ncbi:MAG TPA: hypothetical protein VK629_12685 [Steroidobacteraceae bacterium]|nr:hypothetical protein [Steroidobacteraceae bacterium]
MVSTVGCQTLQAYDGSKLRDNEVARVEGDLSLAAGAPISVILRRIDELDLGLLQSGAKVLPGEHDVLIDCTVTESKHTSRHHLTIDVAAGRKYRFVAETARGNRECSAVQLIER